MTSIPYGNPGLATSSREEFFNYEFFLSDSPKPYTQTGVHTIAENQTISLHQVVGLDANGLVVPAVVGSVAPIGVAALSVTSGVGQNPPISLLRAGHINGDMAIWDASYNTDALKRAAFEGAPTPTNIIVDFNPYNRAA